MTRIHAIDLLKLVVATGVVWAHAVLLSGHVTPATYLFGQGLVRTAVPTFAAISGFLFHSTYRNGKSLRWLTMLLGVYLFWCLIYLPVWLPHPATPRALAADVLLGPIHLWYMAALLAALALIALILTLVPDAARARRWLLGLALGGLFTGTLVQSVDFFTGIDVPLNGYRNGLLVEFPYAVFGYLIADRLRREGRDWLPSGLWLGAGLALLALLRLIEAWLSLRWFGLSVVAPPEIPFLAAAFSVAVLLATLRLNIPAPPVNLGFVSMMLYFLHYGVLLGALHLGIGNVTLLLAIGIALPFAAALLILQILRDFPRQGSPRPVAARRNPPRG